MPSRVLPRPNIGQGDRTLAPTHLRPLALDGAVAIVRRCARATRDRIPPRERELNHTTARKDRHNTMALEVGIVGLPNVDKSTLFNALTAAGALAANYPFATIEPNVGVVAVPDERMEI